MNAIEESFDYDLNVSREDYHYTSKLDRSDMGSLDYLVRHYFEMIFPKMTDYDLDCAVNSVINGVESKLKKGVYLYCENDLVGTVIYHIDGEDVIIDVISWADVEFAMLNEIPTDELNFPFFKKALKRICFLIDKNNNKKPNWFIKFFKKDLKPVQINNIKVYLNKESKCFAKNIKHLGFEPMENTLNENQIYTLKLGNKNGQINSNK